MSGQISVAELKMKSTEELREMLADDSLFSQDDEASAELILEITSIIIQREQKDSVQTEAERLAFWKRLINRNDGRLPVTMQDVLENENENSEVEKRFKQPLPIRIAKKTAIAAVVVLAFFMCNTISAYAFKFDMLHAVIEFTDDILYKRYVAEEGEEESEIADATEGVNSETVMSFQEALDECGIWEIQAPTWMPEGYEFETAQVTVGRDCNLLTVAYQKDNQFVVFNVVQYDEMPDEKTRNFEKSMGDPVIYVSNSVEHYLFGNNDMTTASWSIGMNDCDIQGNIKIEEMKKIIDSMYRED